MFETLSTGNGNGNKMNLRIEILEGLLNSLGEGTNAKINSLKHTIISNKTNMADNPAKSLDLMRRVFQPEITHEFREILDRHMRTTFSPALENLKRNGHVVSDEDIKELCRNILEAAKKPFISVENNDLENGVDVVCFDSDLESETSAMSSMQVLNASSVNTFCPRRRGRPRKPVTDVGPCDIPCLKPGEEMSPQEIAKWNPDRINASTRFILGSKVARILAIGQRGSLYLKYPRAYKYEIDEVDRNWLIENRFTTRLSGKMFIMILEDVYEIASFENYR
ncbi:unnamed protein product [Dracunculus medinensis]|uniref:DNTTIP1_dimer domain-containing protein n=1 Tax=Dracunculus medinensis TaxID=318479 RepID=A0A0N4U1J0_DRAME|nr:unnamed protein product [Dracunculus medinensis]